MRQAELFVALYLAMGWCVVVAAKPLLAAVAPGGIALLVAGGVAYSLGVVFFTTPLCCAMSPWADPFLIPYA